MSRARAAVLTLAVGLTLAVAPRAIMRSNDFATFRDMGAAFLAGAPLYEPMPSTGMRVYYLPSFAWLMVPFALVPRAPAAAIWYALGLAALACAARGLWQAARRESPGASSGWFWVACALAGQFAVESLALGQVNHFVLALLVAGLAAPGRGWAGPAAIGLAGMKVAPLLIGAALGVRHGPAWLARLVATLLLLHLPLLLRYGPSDAGAQYRGLAAAARADKISGAGRGTVGNQGLWGAAERRGLGWPWAGAGALLVAAGMAAAARRAHRALPLWGTLVSGMLLLSPDTRSAHLVLMLVPLAALAGEAATGRRAAVGLLVAAVPVHLLFGADLVGRAVYEWAQRASLYTAYLVLVFGWLVARAMARGGRDDGLPV